MSIELRLGRWQDVLQDVECDALICDPPYSDRTHGANDANAALGRRVIEYAAWGPSDVDGFVASWSPRVRGWFVAFCDDVLAPEWQRALGAAGRYAFAPVPVVVTNSRVRLAGDGPASWTTYIVVARWRTVAAARWGALPGAYVFGCGSGAVRQDGQIVAGQKAMDAMKAIVRDYSRPGDLVCDPCAGGATTLLAAAIEGRRAIGAEMDVDTHAQALARIARGYTPVMQMPEVRAVQGGLDLGGGA